MICAGCGKVRNQSTLTTSSKSSEGDMGGLSVSVKEPPPLSGPLLCDNLPDVNGDTSFIISKHLFKKKNLIQAQN